MTEITNSKTKNITGHKLKTIRLSKGWSQEDVDRLCNLAGLSMTRSKYAKIEAGQIRVTDIMIKDLAKVFDVSINDLFE